MGGPDEAVYLMQSIIAKEKHLAPVINPVNTPGAVGLRNKSGAAADIGAIDAPSSGNRRMIR